MLDNLQGLLITALRAPADHHTPVGGFAAMAPVPWFAEPAQEEQEEVNPWEGVQEEPEEEAVREEHELDLGDWVNAFANGRVTGPGVAGGGSWFGAS